MHARPIRRLVSAAVLVTAVFLGGCSSGGDDSEAGMDAAAQAGGDGGGGGSIGSRGLAAEQEVTTTQYSAASRAADVTGEAPDSYLAPASERVIKTASLRLEVEDGKLGATLTEGRTIAEAAGGFLVSTSVDGSARQHGEFSIRVPAERFEETLSALEELGKIAGEDVTGEDVSEEFVDLEARLRNATAQEEVLFRLYDRSTTIADTIRVQRELEDVQLEIERLRGRLRFLEDRTDLSTISVDVTESGAVTAEAGPFERAWDTARNTFVAVVSGIIVGAGFVLPLLPFALIAYLIFRTVRLRLQRATS